MSMWRFVMICDRIGACLLQFTDSFAKLFHRLKRYKNYVEFQKNIEIASGVTALGKYIQNDQYYKDIG